MAFSIVNYPGDAPADSSKAFTLKPSSPTDIWRKPGPPEISTFNAPMIYKTIPLSSFKRASVTVSGNWSALYDQGGLVFILPSQGSGADGKWIKTGIEFYSKEVYVSTVTKDQWADWSLVQAGVKNGNQVTLEMERNAEEGTLWIYAVDGSKRIPLREVTWILSEKEQDVWVGVYAAKPNEGGNLLVEFTDWELELM